MCVARELQLPPAFVEALRAAVLAEDVDDAVKAKLLRLPDVRVLLQVTRVW